MGRGDGSVGSLNVNGSSGGLNRHQRRVQAFKACGVNPKVAPTESGSRVEGDGGVFPHRFKLNDDIVGEAPKRGDRHPMREVLTASVNIVQNISQAVLVGPCHPCIPYLAHIGFDNGGETSVHAPGAG